MKISIITPSYNQGHFLQETITSVINQGYDNLEYIVIDGGSTDESVSIIKRNEKRIQHWISEKDRGQSNAINKGLARATGDIITWINSDDLLVPGALQKVAAYFSSMPESVGLIHGGTILFDEKKDIARVFQYGLPSVDKYLASMGFSQPASFFRRSFLDKVGLLNEELHYGMDYDLFARLACVSEFRQVDAVFSKYRLHDESKSVAHSDKFRADWNRVFFSICNHLGWNELIGDACAFIPALAEHGPLLTYRFEPDSSVLRSVKKEKVLFYFLSDLLLHYYWYDKRADARSLLAKLRKRFPAPWIREDDRVMAVVKKLAIPEPVLAVLKSVKKILK